MSIPLRVLNIEDNEDDTRLLERTLRRGGYAVTLERVETAEAMRAALAAKTWDIVLSDYQMPRFDGLAALKLLREMDAGLPFIIVSGTIGEDTAVAAMKAGANDYLMKNNLTRLVPAVERELREAEVRRERKRAEQARQQAEHEYRIIFESVQEGIFRTNAEGQFLTANPAIARILGYDSPEELITRVNVHDLYVNPPDCAEFLRRIAEQGQVSGYEYQMRRKDGNVIWVSENARATVLYFESTVRDITKRKRAEELICQNAARAEALAHTAARLNAQLDLDTVLNAVCEETVRALNVSAASVTLLDAARGELNIMASVGLPDDYVRRHKPIPRTRYDELAQDAGAVVVVPDARQLANWPNTELYARHDVRTVAGAKMVRDGALFGTLNVYALGETRTFTADELALLKGLGDQAAQAILNARLFEQEQAQSAELATLYDLSRALADTHDLDAVLDLVARRAVVSSHVTFARLALRQGDDLVVRAGYPTRVLDGDLHIGQRTPLAALPACQRALEQNDPVILHADSAAVSESERALLFLNLAPTLCLVPLHIGREALGVLMLGETRGEAREPVTPDKIRLVRSIGEQAASAIHRAQLHAQTERRLAQLAALRTVDNVITSSLDLNLTLNIVLGQVVRQLNVDAADVLLLREAMQTLEYAVGRGFRSKAIARTRLRLGEGQAGRAALERRLIEIPNVAASGAQFAQPELLAGEDIAAYYAVPLIAKGEVKGVLEVFHRAPLNPNAEWLAFLETLAGQTAIAIDNLALFQGLQRSNLELVLAYNTTIEGWSRALDLRDKETEGHTQRVTAMTEQLARAMGIRDAELVHVRHGALLHDIGKMGVPDGILLKPGKLTDEEWVQMRQHPQLAYDLLLPIAYLRSALDIPYCHHEKWDGMGYPRGLKGEQIPLVARIFAIVDVWDALTSDRPYRPAWSAEKARAHIAEQAGKHFDPKVVEAFFTMLDEER